MHRTSATVTILAVCALIASAPGAPAEMGPCQPDKFGGPICGSGVGAARVIADTLSPSKRLALAWRSTSGPPTEIPSGDTEILVVRVADGAILATSTGTYWDTGEARANRLDESATWSPNSRLLVRSFDSRFSTDNIAARTLTRGQSVIITTG